jgi:hypothetical protein
LNEEVKDERSTRKKDHRHLNNKKKPSSNSLEHHVIRKERQADEALKTRVKLT